jgi:hypothetical protein
MGCYSPKLVKETEIGKSPNTKYNPGQQIASFNSMDLRSDLKNNKRKKDEHDALLKSELVKFRREIEAKYHASQINGVYHFPRAVGDSTSQESLVEETALESTRPNCNLILTISSS